MPMEAYWTHLTGVISFLPFALFAVWPITLVIQFALYRIGRGREKWHRNAALVLCFVPYVAQLMRAGFVMSVNYSGYNGTFAAMWRHNWDKQLLALWAYVGLGLLVYYWGRRRSGGEPWITRKNGLRLFAACVALTIAVAYVLAPYRHLYTAAHHGDVDGLRRALKPWVDPNTPNDWYETPLLLASREDHWEAVDVLLAAGADINYETPWFTSVLAYAIQPGKKERVENLVRRGAHMPTSYRSCDEFHEKLLWLWLDGRSADVLTLEELKVLLDAGLLPDTLLKYEGNPPRKAVTLLDYFARTPEDPRYKLFLEHAGLT